MAHLLGLLLAFRVIAFSGVFTEFIGLIYVGFEKTGYDFAHLERLKINKQPVTSPWPWNS